MFRFFYFIADFNSNSFFINRNVSTNIINNNLNIYKNNFENNKENLTGLKGIIILNSDVNQFKKDDNKKYILLFNNDKSEVTRYAFLYSYQDYMIQEAIDNKYPFHNMTINFSIINNPTDVYSQIIDGKNISIDSIDYPISYMSISILIIDLISSISFIYMRKILI